MWLLLSVNNIRITMDIEADNAILNVHATQPIEVEQIAIIIDTSRPNNTKNDFLTKHIFYGYNPSFKGKFYEEYPFFTSSVEIPKSYLLRKSFDEKVMFFFNRKTFIDTLSDESNFTSFQKKERTSDEIVNYNLTTMIELLFTTVYPSINDNNDSFNKLILKRRLYTLSLDGTIPKPFKSLIPSLNVDFSYIILDGKDYTVTSSCILNDVVNHPEYKKLMLKLVEIKKWKIQTINEITAKLSNLKNKIRFNIKNNFQGKKDDDGRDDGKIQYDKVLYEIVKNTRNYSYYKPNKKVTQNAKELVLLFKNFIEYIDDDNETTTNLKDIKTQINNKYSFQVINSLIDEFLMIVIIKERYFEHKISLIVENRVLSGEIEKYFKLNYTKYADLIKYISGFVSPNRVSSNRELQSMIANFFDNEDDKLQDFMTDVFEKYVNDNNSLRKMNGFESLLSTGVNSYNTENNIGKLKYEAYVSFNLILGKLTQEDLSNISCEYKDEELGIQFDSNRTDKLIKTSIHTPRLIDREKMIKKVIDKNTKINGGRKKRRNTNESRKKNTMKLKISSRKKNTLKKRKI